jgi:hypothetical protein
MALVLTLAVHLSESASSGVGEVSPYLVGGIILAVLVVAILAVVSIGGGRDHT